MSERRQQRTGRARLVPLVPLVSIWTLGVLFLAGLILQREVPYSDLVLDPNALNGAPWYYGLVSNLGVLGWTSAATTAFFGAWVARYGNRPAAAKMLLGGAALSTILLLDDLFQLHVIVKPLLGIPKTVVYASYLALGSTWLVSQYREIRRTRIVLLVAAGGALSLSVVADQVTKVVGGLDPNLVLIVEDGAKFLGVLAWAQYFTLTSTDVVRSIVIQLRASAAIRPNHSSAPVPVEA